MGLYTDSISTSVAFKVNEAQRDTDRNLRRLSSGERILRPEDDAGAMQVAMKLDGSRKRSDVALLGLQNVRSYTEAQDNALMVVGQMFTRLSELATLAMDSTKNSTDRSSYDYEFQNLVKEIRRIDLQEFNDIRLFRGTTYKLFDVAANMKWSEAKAAVDAQDAADSLNYHYLATITSQSEQDEIARQIGDVGINAWLGGQDTAVEGEWRWTEGPEGKENGGQGRQFWSGTSGGSAVGGAFEKWGHSVNPPYNQNEPNNAGNEDYLQISQRVQFDGSTGAWNDLADTNSSSPTYQPRGYVRETEEAICQSPTMRMGVPTVSPKSATPPAGQGMSCTSPTRCSAR